MAHSVAEMVLLIVDGNFDYNETESMCGSCSCCGKDDMDVREAFAADDSVYVHLCEDCLDAAYEKANKILGWGV